MVTALIVCTMKAQKGMFLLLLLIIYKLAVFLVDKHQQ